ncbi:hypothetical protein VPH35_110521 [Triticum aestivum]
MARLSVWRRRESCVRRCFMGRSFTGLSIPSMYLCLHPISGSLFSKISAPLLLRLVADYLQNLSRDVLPHNVHFVVSDFHLLWRASNNFSFSMSFYYPECVRPS